MARDHDFFVNARRVVEQAIGENIDGSPLVNKGSRAVAGSKGGKIGGKARAEKLSALRILIMPNYRRFTALRWITRRAILRPVASVAI
jgi:hypothetical protein